MKARFSAVAALLLLAAGAGLGAILVDQPAEAQNPATSVGRYQVSSYAGAGPGSGVHHGCYVIDTHTGRLWHAGAGTQPVEVAKRMP